MVRVDIPSLRWQRNKRKWQRNAIRIESGKLFPSMSNYDIRLEKISYYPYWAGKVLTVKSRLIFGDKSIFFYVIGNGLNGTYLVMRNLPNFTEREVPSSDILPFQVSRAQFEEEIVDEAINVHIVRQFMFGAPYFEKLGSRLLYIPMQEILLKPKGSEEFGRYFVNVFNGRVEAWPQ